MKICFSGGQVALGGRTDGRHNTANSRFAILRPPLKTDTIIEPSVSVLCFNFS